MKHRYQNPDPLLSDYIRSVLLGDETWTSESDDLPIVTTGMPLLFCQLDRDKNGQVIISRFTLCGNGLADGWKANEGSTIIIYFFKPFALTSLFNISAKEMKQGAIDISMWSPHKFNALRTQFAYVQSVDEMILILDNLIHQQLKLNAVPCQTIRYATDQIMWNPEISVLPKLLEELNLTERTFQRMFKKYVGITATQYRRICQFQQAFGQLRSKQYSKVSEVAFDNNFSDQSHFIRSFKEFTEITPSDYLREGLNNKVR